ncbi:MAG: dTDP-glucose 4,6-dehydratase [Alicyclobacillus sp.]|nr:dTDP-glucose 4,6-dehydratase [Alicyclobacillus sp.]
MNLLITGGAGFIASNFIRYLLQTRPDDHIINLDALTYAGNLASLTDVSTDPRYTFIKADITYVEAIDQVVQRGIDVIINFSAESHVDRSILDPAAFVRTNVLGTQVLLDAARKYGVKKFVQVSTDEVYGALGPDDPAFTETTPLQPNSPYSASKASADLLVRAYHETYGLPVNITRCSNNYGPYQFPEKLIPLMIINALEDKPLPVYGDGLQIRDWLHVWDHCAGIDLVIRNGRPGEVYNIGGNNERTNLEIVRTILRTLGKPESLIQHVADRPGHDRRYAINATKIRAELGWAPKYTFETGIQETIDWYLTHREWWEAVRTGEYRDFYDKQYKARLGADKT